MSQIIRLFTLILYTLLLAGCSSTTLTASWKNPEFNQHLENVYLVGVAKNDVNRRLFEDAFKQKLDQVGASGIVSYTDFPKDESDKDRVMAKAKSRQADSILISRMVKKRTETVVEPGRITTYRTGYAPYYSPYYERYDDFYSRRYETIYEPPTINQYDIATIEANLYSIESGELIWAAQLEVVAEGNLKKIVEDFIAVVMRDLKEKGLL